jgi:hypothetical protein
VQSYAERSGSMAEFRWDTLRGKFFHTFDTDNKIKAIC